MNKKCLIYEMNMYEQFQGENNQGLNAAIAPLIRICNIDISRIPDLQA